jgi:hypothetical protein
MNTVKSHLQILHKTYSHYDMGMSNKGHSILAQASAQLSPQTQQKVNVHIEEILMQTIGF